VDQFGKRQGNKDCGKTKRNECRKHDDDDGPSCLACAAKTSNIQNKKGHEKLSLEEKAKKSSSKKERTSDQGRGGVGCSCH
jgi:hypothetical protein